MGYITSASLTMSILGHTFYTFNLVAAAACIAPMRLAYQTLDWHFCIAVQSEDQPLGLC